jgi:manganese transport protein
VHPRKLNYQIYNNKKIQFLAWLVAAVLVYLNGNLVFDFVSAYLGSTHQLILKGAIILAVLFFAGLLVFITLYPLVAKAKRNVGGDFHGEAVELDWSSTPPVQRIVIAVDFSSSDKKLIQTAIAHATNPTLSSMQETAEFIFIHVVESATARYLLEASDDIESRKDQERLEAYASAVRQNGYKASTVLGYQNRVKEIVRIVYEKDAQLLVMGAHKHQGWKDYIFGETIEAVRHKVSIPVLIVND